MVSDVYGNLAKNNLIFLGIPNCCFPIGIFLLPWGFIMSVFQHSAQRRAHVKFKVECIDSRSVNNDYLNNGRKD